MKVLIQIITVFIFLFISVSCSEKSSQEFEIQDINNNYINIINDSINSENTNNTDNSNFKYLALGDSYTVGTNVSKEESYPYLLTENLKEKITPNVNLQIIAKAGWATDNLLNGLKTNTTEPPYNLVTLLIGVNNQFQGRDFSTYEKEFPELLIQALALANNKNEHVIVISIPDYGYTPFGELSKTEISKEIDEYNTFAQVIANEYNVTFVNITDITRRGLIQKDLVAKDGLHPSGLAYQAFVERLSPIILNQLKD